MLNDSNINHSKLFYTIWWPQLQFFLWPWPCCATWLWVLEAIKRYWCASCILLFKSRRSLRGHAGCHKKHILLPFIFIPTMWHQNLQPFTFFKANKINIKNCNFKVLVFKSRSSLWGQEVTRSMFYWLLKVFSWIFHWIWKKYFKSYSDL